MRLCFLGDAGSIHLQRWLNYFTAAGHQVDVISFRPCPVPGVTVHLLAGGKSGSLSYIKGMLKIRSLLREIKPDLLHAHYATSFGLLALVTGFHPLVVSAWGSDVLVAPDKSKLLRLLVKRVLRQADALTSDSAHMSARMEELLAGRQKPLKTVTMGVSQEWLSNPPQVSRKAKQILSLRIHSENYNIETVIRATAKVLEQVPEANLVVAAEGPGTAVLKDVASSLGIGAKVEFVGQLSHAGVQRYLHESAISVSVPSSDATAVSLLETMACGTFPVISALPANREWIDDGVNGLLVKARDEDALAAAVLHALQDESLRQQAEEMNRERIVSRAVWENNMAEMEELYSRLLGK